jgi:hypothetical protein
VPVGVRVGEHEARVDDLDGARPATDVAGQPGVPGGMDVGDGDGVADREPRRSFDLPNEGRGRWGGRRQADAGRGGGSGVAPRG